MTKTISKIIFPLLIFIGAAIWFFHDRGIDSPFLNQWFAPILDPVIAIGTIVLAAWIGLQKLGDELDKKVTIHFKVKDPQDGQFKYLLSCYQTYLSGESDIRQWAMQIGGQMTKGARLELYPHIEQTEKNYFFKGYKLYTVTMFLKAYPDNSKGYIARDYLVWWDNEKLTSSQQKFYFSNGLRNEPISLDDLENVDFHISKTSKNSTLINLSNHDFLPEQQSAAKEILGENINYVKIPFPNIDASASTKEVKVEADKFVKKILSYNPAMVHIAGEPTFVFHVVNLLSKLDIRCVTSTTERIVVEEGDKKISKFRFNHFRAFIIEEY